MRRVPWTCSAHLDRHAAVARFVDLVGRRHGQVALAAARRLDALARKTALDQELPQLHSAQPREQVVLRLVPTVSVWPVTTMSAPGQLAAAASISCSVRCRLGQDRAAGVEVDGVALRPWRHQVEQGGVVPCGPGRSAASTTGAPVAPTAAVARW